MDNSLQTATFAGGCFWCTEAIFKRLKGVIEVTSGYSSGKTENPTYEQVSKGNTDYAESIQIKFDPKTISFDKLLDIFWDTHDPTTLNQQGADIGTQYRSVIFYHNDEQKRQAEQSKEKLEQSKELPTKIVTKIEPYNKFFPAEEYHQNYYDKNKNINPYCPFVIDPKIEKLLTKFNESVKEGYK